MIVLNLTMMLFNYLQLISNAFLAVFALKVLYQICYVHCVFPTRFKSVKMVKAMEYFGCSNSYFRDIFRTNLFHKSASSFHSEVNFNDFLS